MGPIEEAIFKCSESIHRGDKCTECGASWDEGTLLHARRCVYIICEDAVDEADD